MPMPDDFNPNLAEPAPKRCPECGFDGHDDVLKMEKALIEAAEHFEAIERRALHWMKVFANNEFSEARWSEIKRYAGHRARAIRELL